MHNYTNNSNLKHCGCPTQKMCGCSSKIDAKCVIYDSKKLDPICILNGDNLEEIIKKINDLFKSMSFDIDNAFVAMNVGGKVEVYKGQNSNCVEEFRTLQGVEGITVIQDGDIVKIKIDTEWLEDHYPKISLSNIGMGIELMRPSGVNNYGIKKVRSTDNTVDISEDPSGGVDFKVNPNLISPFNDIGTDGNGTPIYNGTVNKRIGISSLKSDTLKIEKEPNGTININSISTEFNYLKAYYVNANYVPTVDSPADGSIIRPFPTFDEAITKVIGNGTILNPENAGARIIVQTSSSTATNPTVNTVTIELQNVGLTYTGSDLYMFDTEILYPLVPKDSNNEITQSIYMNIVGNGTLSRTNGIGFVRSIGAKRGNSTTINNFNTIYIRLGEKETDNITILERDDYPDVIWGGDLLRPNGDKIGDSYNPPSILKWTTQLNPTTPLIMAKGNSFSSFTFSMFGAGRLNIYTLANTGLWVEDTLVSWNKLHLNPISHRITVQNGNVGVPGYATDIYQPKEFPAIYAKNANFYVDSIYHTNGGTFSHHGWDTFIKVEGTFNLNGMFNYDTNYYMETFIDVVNATQVHFQINGKTGSANLNSRIQYLIDSSVNGDFNLMMPNSVLSGIKNISKNANTNIIPQTKGTLASINGTPYISGINTYADDNTALANNLLKNAIYLNPSQTMTTL